MGQCRCAASVLAMMRSRRAGRGYVRPLDLIARRHDVCPWSSHELSREAK